MPRLSRARRLPSLSSVAGLLLAAVLSLCLAGRAAAQVPDRAPNPGDEVVFTTTEPQRNAKAGKVLRAIRVAEGPVLDGRVDEDVWTRAPVATGFVQREPENGQGMTEDTRVQVVYDTRFVYVAFSVFERSADLILDGLGRRDEMPQTDEVAVGFDPRHDHLTGFLFQTNPSGWQGDSFMFDDTSRDRDYNAVWEVRTARAPWGWAAEFRIPFSQLRFQASPLPGQVWGFNAQRQIRRRNENGTWVGRARGQVGEVSFFGHLVFDEPIAPPRRLELTPYALARTEQRTAGDEDHGAAVGVDVRRGIGTAATFSATLNPDFGQVEQDPAVLNLSIFENFFPERRPFFLEDSRTFVPSIGLFQLFHSRRIGRAPGRLPLYAGDTLVDRADDTTILGAGKLTGKSGSWTYGALTAMTSREYALVERGATADSGSPRVRVEHLIEPATSYNVARLQRDFRGSSNAGLIGTATLRERGDDAYTGGLDYRFRWDQNRTSVDGHWVVTHAPGAGGVRTSGGGVANVGVSHKHYEVGGHYDRFGRDFRVTDLGFFRSRPNRSNVQAYAGFGTPDPGKRLRRVFGYLNFNQSWNDEGLVFDRWIEANANIQFLNFWGTNFGAGSSTDTLDDLDARGGPPILRQARQFLFFNIFSDSRKRWRVNWGANVGRSRAPDWDWNTFTNFSVQASDRLQASASANYEVGTQAAQWITNTDATGDGVTDHVYGHLRRNVLNITLRGTYAFSRDLTLQAFLQPFVAVGDYGQTRRLARARSFDFEPVALSYDPDFSTKSLRGNIVLRWEFIRGSTFFLVWDMSQADAARPGVFSPVRDLGSAFGANANHTVIAKMSYWLNR